MAVVQQYSADSLLSLLNEDDQALKLYALQSLNKVVHDFWYQIASSIASVEAFYEDEAFVHRELAAVVASKVFYHLGELDDALTYALGAGTLFDINEQSEYVQTLLARCLDLYIAARTAPAENDSAPQIDPRLTAIVERMFERCLHDGQYEQAIGVALEVRRLDLLETAIKASPDASAILKYSLQVCQRLVIQRSFRQEVLKLLIRLCEAAPEPDWVNICQCLMFLDNASEVAKILHRLLHSSTDDVLLAYQVCFDLFENEMQSFLLKVGEALDALNPQPVADADTTPQASPSNGHAAPSDQAVAGASDNGNAMEVDNPPAENGSAAAANGDAPSAEPARSPQDRRLRGIISGQTPIQLYLEFLFSHNHADVAVLKNAKGAVEARNSVCHSAVIFANAIMHSGTTVDSFLRDNLEWLSRATNWAKFGATAGLGVIHRGHLSQGRALMAPYLPRDGGSTGSAYSEGGALYALGLIHANHGQPIMEFLLQMLRSTANEVTQHGACLGLGLAGLGTNNAELFEELKNILYTDSAVAGEAAGLGLGLLAVGSATDKAGELLAYAHDTQHEKIIRGLALGLAFIMYGREEGAETLIEQLTRDQDPILRYGGMYTIGMAYRGTANNSAIQKLLHFAVSDVSDDVRRAAVLCLGFVLMGVPEQCPRIVALLAESYNPHVRYGAAMAVGLSCAATGMDAAVDLLQPLLTDAVDFVRQGALIATALVLVQAPHHKEQVSSFSKFLAKVAADKHEETMGRMGAIMALGILDAGGRNATIGLRSTSGYFRRTSVVAMAVFTHYWYWYPLAYFLSLALQPTALIGLNAELQVPKMQVTAKCKPSAFAYPQPLAEETNAAASKVPTAVLSTTARARERAKKREKPNAKRMRPPTPAPAEPSPSRATGATSGPTAMDTDQPSTSGAAGEPSKAGASKGEEPSSHTLQNPMRVVPAQEQYIAFDADPRWEPLRRHHQASGILMLRDKQPGQPVELVGAAAPEQSPSTPAVPASGPATAPDPAAQNTAEELPPPEPFEYTG